MRRRQDPDHRELARLAALSGRSLEELRNEAMAEGLALLRRERRPAMVRRRPIMRPRDGRNNP